MATPPIDLMKSIRRAIALVLVPLVAVACTRTIDVPVQQLESSRNVTTPYRVTMKDGTQYRARQFTVTDSTLVIKDLLPSDPRRDEATLPIVVSLDDVASVQKSDTTAWFWVGGVVVAAFIVVGLAISHVGVAGD